MSTFIKIFFVLLHCIVKFSWAADAQTYKSLGFFYCPYLIPHIAVSYPRIKAVMVLKVHENVLCSGTGDTVFLLPKTNCIVQMKNSINEHLTVFNYEGANITFKTVEGVLMVNATEMAKPFGKEPKDFLKNKQTKEYITILSQSENSPTEKIVQVQNGGSNPGTWLHELIALRFAQWLSPQFSVWVDKHIKELLYNGQTRVVDKYPGGMCNNTLVTRIFACYRTPRGLEWYAPEYMSKADFDMVMYMLEQAKVKK